MGSEMAIINTNEIPDGRSASEVVEQCPSLCTTEKCRGFCPGSGGKELELGEDGSRGQAQAGCE